MAAPNTDAPKRTRGMSQTDWQLALYVYRWQRYLRRFSRRLPANAPIRVDMRYWEARRCSVDVADLSAFLWFFGLNVVNRYQLYTSARDVRRDAFFESGNRSIHGKKLHIHGNVSWCLGYTPTTNGQSPWDVKKHGDAIKQF